LTNDLNLLFSLKIPLQNNLVSKYEVYRNYNRPVDAVVLDTHGKKPYADHLNIASLAKKFKSSIQFLFKMTDFKF